MVFTSIILNQVDREALNYAALDSARPRHVVLWWVVLLHALVIYFFAAVILLAGDNFTPEGSLAVQSVYERTLLWLTRTPWVWVAMAGVNGVNLWAFARARRGGRPVGMWGVVLAAQLLLSVISVVAQFLFARHGFITLRSGPGGFSLTQATPQDIVVSAIASGIVAGVPIVAAAVALATGISRKERT